MIDISELNSRHIGAQVQYMPDPPRPETVEYGVITNWNKHYVFVRYGKNQNSKATDPDDLLFCEF